MELGNDFILKFNASLIASLRAIADGGSNRWLDFIERECDKSDDLPLPDFISGDFDSILSKTKCFFEKRQVCFISTPDQDATDFTKAVNCIDEVLKSKNLTINEIIVLCENSGRFDQIMANINTLHKNVKILNTVSLLILSSSDISWVLPEGEHIIKIPAEFVEKEYHCGLIPFCGPTKVKTSGLKWELDSVSEFGKTVSTSNTYAASEVYISCNRSILWTAEYC